MIQEGDTLVIRTVLYILVRYTWKTYSYIWQYEIILYILK
jgi:hypothetical protein